MIFLLSCSNLHDSVKANIDQYISKEFIDACEEGSLEKTLNFLENEKNINGKYLVSVQSSQKQLNYPFALIHLWQGDNRDRDKILEYLFEFMTHSSKNFIDPNELIDGGHLIALITGYCSFDTFMKFILKSGANLNGHAQNIPSVLIALFQQEHLSEAIEGCHSKFEYFLKMGANLENEKGGIVAAYAFWTNNLQALKLMKKYGRDFNKKLVNGLPPSAYAAVRGNAEILEWALANSAKFIDKKDICKMWAKKIASLAMFSVTAAALDSARGLLGSVISIFSKMLETYASEFLTIQFNEVKKKESWYYVSYLLGKGNWATHLGENQWDMLRYAIKMLKERIEDPEILSTLNDLYINVKNKRIPWSEAIATYSVSVGKIDIQKIETPSYTETLKRVPKVLYIEDKFKYAYTEPRRASTIKDAIDSKSPFLFNDELPDVALAKIIVKIANLPEGKYFTKPNYLGDCFLVVKQEQEITTEEFDGSSDAEHSFFFAQRVE